MSSSATYFINNRKSFLTENRLKAILSYICDCYKICAKEKSLSPYSISSQAKSSTIHFEDFLKFELIDNYLNINKSLLKSKFSALEDIHFSSETQERYIDTDNLEKPDKIDIYINKIGLQEEWKVVNDNIYFAIECKRIRTLNDSTKYVEDICKMTKRNYLNLRLPYEGQLAFIENKDIDHQLLSNKINKLLEINEEIITSKFLLFEKLNELIDSTYISEHHKSFDKKKIFSIYHLLLDYSRIVMD